MCLPECQLLTVFWPAPSVYCGDRIREARLRARLSQSDLCRRLQLAGVIVERDVISRIENGGRFVADFEVVVIADVLEVSVDWLLGKE